MGVSRSPVPATVHPAGRTTIIAGPSVGGGIDNSLSRLGRRSCTIFCFWAELEDLAGVVGEDE